MFANTCAASSPPDIASPSQEPLSSSRGCVDSRPNIKVEDREPMGVRVPRVVVDHVSNFFRAVGSLANDIPIVAIEWRVRPVDSSQHFFIYMAFKSPHSNLAGYAQLRA